MRRRSEILTATVIVICGLLSDAGAAGSGTAPGIWFGGAAGIGSPSIEHPEVSPGLKTGAFLVLDFGWSLSKRWAIGGEFTTWETSPLGTPVHLHTIGPRVEFAPWGPAGLFARATAGLALTEGEVKARAGGAGAVAFGRRWLLGEWVGLSAEGGLHAHAYGNGHAIVPFIGTELRFYGLTRR